MPESLSHTLTELLRMREECFVTVWECEEKLREILPGFPIPQPPDLPSRRKRIKKQIIHPSADARENETNGRIKFRELNRETENAYRLVFLYGGQEQSSFQTETSLSSAMANMNTDDFIMLAVETVSFKSMNEWKTRDILWKNPLSVKTEIKTEQETPEKDNE